MHNYESPINEIVQIVNDVARNVREEEDKFILEYIQDIGIDVDKDELIKALQYDRQQYDKGYEDGYADANEVLDKIIEELKSNIWESNTDYNNGYRDSLSIALNIIERYKK